MSARRYEATGIETELEPGSRGRVLRNKLGIRRVRDMNLAESQALAIAQDLLFDQFGSRHRFTASNVCQMHAVWLEDIYKWAGSYRSVNIAKDGFQFAHTPLIANLMAQLEKGALRRHTPCHAADDRDVALALAEVHAELILVHPFREGNGRLARLLAVLMAAQAGLPALDFTPMLGRGRRAYIASIHAAMGRDYRPLAGIFEKVIARSRLLADARTR